jgi:sodium-dependent dicarboxylate transporter 2/3/5
MALLPLRLSPGLPEGIRRPVAALLLCLVAAGLAWVAHAAGWPREQVIGTGVLVVTVLLWVTETLPLFATAFISIALQMILLGNPGRWSWLRFESRPGPTIDDVLAAAIDPVLLLFFGGLVLSRAAVKTGVDRTLAAIVLRPAAGTPAHLLLGVIVATSFFSLWMSNTATTALMLALVGPILQQLPEREPFRKAIILSVPVTANIAGMSTPIASPPNAIAMSYIAKAGEEIGFAEWMLLAIPLVVVLLAATWWWLLRLFPASSSDWRIELQPARLSGRGAWVICVSAVTFMAWMTEPWHGVPASVVALLPATLFFSTAIITRDDVNSLDWDVLLLIAGGLALGAMLQSTHLDARLAGIIPRSTGDGIRLVLLAATTLTLGTFFSNTAIASMLVPVAVATAGLSTSMGLATFVLTTAFVSSLSMALPMSTPPNAMAHASGELTSRDFLRTGGRIGLAGAAVIVLVAVAWSGLEGR